MTPNKDALLDKINDMDTVAKDVHYGNDEDFTFDTKEAVSGYVIELVQALRVALKANEYYAQPRKRDHGLVVAEEARAEIERIILGNKRQDHDRTSPRRSG
jgi:hypothetical protein